MKRPENMTREELIDRVYVLEDQALEFRVANTIAVIQQAYSLTPMEARLVEILYLAKGRIVPRSLILETLWDEEKQYDSKDVDVLVCRIRARMGRETILTCYGRGIALSRVAQDTISSLLKIPFNEIIPSFPARSTARNAMPRTRGEGKAHAVLSRLAKGHATTGILRECVKADLHEVHGVLRTLRGKGLVERIGAGGQGTAAVYGLTAAGRAKFHRTEKAA